MSYSCPCPIKIPLRYIGALTSKSYAFSGRPWESESYKSIDFFDFFANPVSFHLRDHEIVRVTNSDSVYWISDSIRFYSQLFKSIEYSYPVVKWRFFPARISWFEAAIAANASLFSIQNYFNLFQFSFCKINCNPKISNFSIFSTGRYVDAKDFSLIRAQVFKVKNSCFYFPHLNGAFFSRSPFCQDTTNKNYKTHITNFIDGDHINKNIKFCFIFSSTLRYENPILNAKIKELVTTTGLVVYLFGFNNSYLFNYKVNYIGGVRMLPVLFAGRFKVISGHFFSDLSFSIFGFWFRKPEVIEKFKIKNIFLKLSQAIFLQPDFSQNSIYLFQDNCNTFKPYVASTIKSSILRVTLFNFNVHRVFKFPSKSINKMFWDLGKYFTIQHFNFGPAFADSYYRLNYYSFPTIMLVSFSTFYFNLSNNVKKISNITTKSGFGDRRGFFNTINYTFNAVCNKYNRYRFYYFSHLNSAAKLEHFNNKFSCQFSKMNCSIFFSYSSLFQLLFFSKYFMIYVINNFNISLISQSRFKFSNLFFGSRIYNSNYLELVLLGYTYRACF